MVFVADNHWWKEYGFMVGWISGEVLEDLSLFEISELARGRDKGAKSTTAVNAASEALQKCLHWTKGA